MLWSRPITGHLTCQLSCGLRGEAGLIIPAEETEDEGVWSGTAGAWSGGGDEAPETEI